MELFAAPKTRGHILIINSDFGENILVVSKHETSDQFFHRLEVCLFGSVCILSVEDAERIADFEVSHIVTSDLKYEFLYFE